MIRRRVERQELERNTNRRMSMKIRNITGAVATSFATKMLLLAQGSAADAVPTVQSQQTMTVNSYRTTSGARTFAVTRKPLHLFPA